MRGVWVELGEHGGGDWGASEPVREIWARREDHVAEYGGVEKGDTWKEDHEKAGCSSHVFRDGWLHHAFRGESDSQCEFCWFSVLLIPKDLLTITSAQELCFS